MNLIKTMIAASCAAVVLTVSPPSAAQQRLWGTYYGGAAQGEHAKNVAVDAFGAVYVVGSTISDDGVATQNAFDSQRTDGYYAGYLAKFDTNGKQIWGTYYGDEAGPSDLFPTAELVDVGLDPSGNIYVLGNIKCPSFQLATAGAPQSTCKGPRDMYLAKFTPSGKRIWGTYFGGNAVERAKALSVTGAGAVYIAGETRSSQGIASASSPDFSLGGEADGVIAKFSPSGEKMWSRYYGGEAIDDVTDIACRTSSDPSVDICFVTGATYSKTGMATLEAHDVALSGGMDGFVARIDGVGGKRVWGSYYGGERLDWGENIVVDKSFNVYVGGVTKSLLMIATANAFKKNLGGDGDNFLVKFNANGARQAATYFGEGAFPGGDDYDALEGLALDPAGNVYALGVAGVESGFGSQATSNAFDKTLSGPTDAVITKFNPALGRVWSTYYGGSDLELASTFGGGGIAVGANSQIHVVGDTFSTDVMATPGAHKTMSDGWDAFLVEFGQ